MTQQPLWNERLLSEAQESLAEELRTVGETRCECCARLVKIYKRQIAGRTAADCIRLYRLRGGGYHHVSEFKRGTDGEFAKLRYWGLVVEQPKDVDDTTKRTSGYWMLTERGFQWVTKTIAISKYLLLLDGELIGFAGPKIDIAESLGKTFDYGELMGL